MEEKTKENHKKIRIKSHGFIPFVIIWCTIGLSSVILQKCLYYYSFYWDQGIRNALGIGSQIITACIVCILQILGISFSVQTNEWNGLKLYELREMRKDKHFSFLATTIISIGLLIICIFCYSFELYIVCIGASICAVILCVYVLYTELPLLTMNQDAMLKIIRDNIVSKFKPNTELPLLTMNQDAMLKIIRDNIVSKFKSNELLTSKMIKAIEYIILDKDVIAIYDSLKLNNQIEYNKHLLKILLDIQKKMAFKLDTISDDSLKQKIIDNFWGTIRSIFNGKFDGEFNIIDILMEIKDYKRHIVSVLFQLLKHDKNGRISNTLFTDYIFFFKYEKNIKPIQQKLFTNAIVIIIIETVKNNDLKYLSEFRKQLSLHYYTLSDNSNISLTSLTFAIISFFLYYISELEQNRPEKLKENILEFIEYEGKGVVNNSWKKLFEYFACKFNIDYKRFVELYEENKSSIEYISSLADWVTLSEEVVNDWFMANLLNKQDCFNDDYSLLLKDLTKGQVNYYLESFVEENFYDKTFKPSQKLLKIINFYSNESDPFYTFSAIEERHHNFINYYEKLKIEKLEKDAEANDHIDNKDLVDKYKPEIERILKNEWKIDKEIDLSSERSKYISIIFEKNPDVINRDEFITKDVFANSVFNDIRKNINCTTIKRNDFTKQLNNIMQLDIKYTTGNTINLSYMIDNEGIRKSYMEYVSNKEKIQSNILVGYYFVLENGYSINIAIDSFTVNDLNEKQLNQKVDEYSRADGQYVYEGVFMQREDVVRLIKNRFATYTLIFKYKLNINPEEIIRIEN